VILRVIEPSQVGEARRATHRLAQQIGFDPTGCGRADLVATEAASNLVKHAREGLLLLRPLTGAEGDGLEILALDKGPGMADVGRCLRDGFSTAGSPGTGLGAIARLAGGWDIYSNPTAGTALLARFWLRPPSWGKGVLQLGVVSAPMKGEVVCGDAWASERDGERSLLLMVDGLGHGPEAAQAAQTAVRVFQDNVRHSPAAILQAIHRALLSTRGAAASVAEVDTAGECLRYAGVGNIAGLVIQNGASRSLVSHNGTLGHVARSFQEFTLAFPASATLLLYSDGLTSRWGLEAYPGLLTHAPALLAGVLYRDFQRGRDDVTVLAARAMEGAL